MYYQQYILINGEIEKVEAEMVLVRESGYLLGVVVSKKTR